MFRPYMQRAALLFAMSALIALPAGAQETGHGDLFGDLYHILRNPDTGQPILQKRWILGEQDLYVWAYCPIPVDINGEEIPFLPDSCELDAAALERVIEVDYFGRLSGGRTKERNLRMHFDEVIVNIQLADIVVMEADGRLKMGTDCESDSLCATWKVVDSPQENMAVYHRLMKYGHLQTNPLEEDTSFHGDPELGTVYHPALRAEDWAKFRGVLTNLLPADSAGECFSGESFTAACALPQALTAEDFVRAASVLAGAADKHGKITMDLVQYINRILRITESTPESMATLNTLPALIRDVDGVTIFPATLDMGFPASELFVDFGPASYLRTVRFTMTIPALVPAGTGLWAENPSVSLLPFLEYTNGAPGLASGIDGFIKNASDALRAVEFIHEYAIPVDLYAVYSKPTTTTVEPVTMAYSAADHTVTLTANVTAAVPVNVGTVSFVVQTEATVQIGSTVVSGTVTNGVATASFVVPGAAPAQTLTILATYSGAPGFLSSTGSGTLTITPAPPSGEILAAENARADFYGGDGSDLLVQDIVTGDLSAWVLDGLDVAEKVSLTPSAVIDTNWRIAATGDFDGNLTADIVFQHVTTGSLYLWYMDGITQSSGSHFSHDVVNPAWKLVAVGDFNGDSFPDLVLHNQAEGRVLFWLCEGAAVKSFVEMPIVLADKNWVVAGAADFDDDGETDLLLHHQGHGEVGVWLMNGTTREQYLTLTPGTMTTGWQVAAIIDANLDAKADIVWQNTDGSLKVWYMNALVGTEQNLSEVLPLNSRVVGPK